MSPRSFLLFAAFLLAASAAAQWSDIIYSNVLNVTAKRLCAVDVPDYCMLVPAINATVDPDRTYVVAVFYDVRAWAWRAAPVVHPNTMLTFYDWINITVYTPAGYILAPQTVAVNGAVPDTVPVCGKNHTAVRVQAGAQRLSGTFYYICGTSFCYEPIRFLNPTDCSTFPLVEHIYMLHNITSGWAYVYIFHMPSGREVHVGQLAGARIDPWYDYINGTAHLYRLQVRVGLPAGSGFYIANRTRIPAVAATAPDASVYAGPIAHDRLNAWINWDYMHPSFTIYTIGQHPGDGVACVAVPYFVPISVPAGLAFISNDTAGYFRINVVPDHGVPFHLFVRRYAIVELAISDALLTYTTRTIACPPYVGNTTGRIFTIPLRADTAREIELCNNKTSAAYLALAVNRYGLVYFTFIDRAEPGECRRLRWDGSFVAANTMLYIYPSAHDVCLGQHEAVKQGGQDYLAGWRYYLMQDNSLIRAQPIDPDELYAELWRQIMQNLARQYNETVNALQQWLQMQANATKKIEDYYRSLPQYQGTIRMDSSTSVWLRTVHNVLRSYTVPVPGGGFALAPVTAPAVPLAIAPAAAAAVAVAWAASRRDDDVVTTAVVAGIALAVFGLLMTLIYGSESLLLVPLGIIIAAAAAAWKRI